MKANIKDLLIGIILGLMLALAIGVYAQNDVLDNGRYQISYISERFYYVIDTRSGDVYYGSADESLKFFEDRVTKMIQVGTIGK